MLGQLRIRSADSFASRALCLLVGKPLAADEGLLIAPCSSIHTIGMRYSIDVVFLDRDARILKICPAVRAGRMRFALGARAALELRSGVAAAHGLAPGMRLLELAESVS